LIWNPEAETMPRAARERLQLERLQDTVRWAVEHVPFHRERLGGATLRALADLASLPFVRKTDLREQYPFGLLAVPRREVARIHASSGTKGKPTVAAYTAGDLDLWREVMARALTAAGTRRGDLLHIAFGYGLFTGGLGFHDGAERVGMTVVPVSSGNTAPSSPAARLQAGRDRGDGLHIADDHFLPEIIDPASGTVLPMGREGELVFTTVTNRTSARMARVKGRSDDMLIVKGINLYPSEVERALLAVEELAPHYQLVVDRGATLAWLEVQVEPAPELIARCGGLSPQPP
jgi:phenylacetate-coenzyme A ligase PaaK-like adenylate-forming protein